jgi:hypothetical protein
MKPIYFPFTYVSDPVAKALSACFGQFVIYRPVSENLSEQMQLWINRGVMDVRVPVTENENELKTAVKNYQIWADLHRKGLSEKTAILKTRMDSLPFFSEFSFSKIVEDMKEKIHYNSNTQIPDPVLAARIFLYFAQEFDRQNYELSCDLNLYDQQEEELIRQLKMEDDPVVGQFRNAPMTLPNPFADYMISDRLAAWTRIFCQDSEVSGLFVTHSPAILEYLRDRASTVARVMNIESIPLGEENYGERESWQERLALNLVRLVENKQTASSEESIEQLDLPTAENTVSLSIYRVPDQTPHEFFTHCAEINRPAADGADRKSTSNNTLIALVQESLNG